MRAARTLGERRQRENHRRRQQDKRPEIADLIETLLSRRIGQARHIGEQAAQRPPRHRNGPVAAAAAPQ